MKGLIRIVFALAFVGIASTAHAQTPVVVLQDIYEALTAAAAQDVAHDAADSGNPVKIGGKALALGSNPTGVTANDRTNCYATRAGQIFMLGGHPNVITETATVADADGAQTGTAIVSVSAGTRIVLTGFAVTCSNANTVNVAFTLAFDTDATFASASTAGVVGSLAKHSGIAPGSGFARGSGDGVLGIGADDEDLRYSLADPVTGGCDITVQYFTIEG